MLNRLGDNIDFPEGKADPYRFIYRGTNQELVEIVLRTACYEGHTLKKADESEV